MTSNDELKLSAWSPFGVPGSPSGNSGKTYKSVSFRPTSTLQSTTTTTQQSTHHNKWNNGNTRDCTSGNTASGSAPVSYNSLPVANGGSLWKQQPVASDTQELASPWQLQYKQPDGNGIVAQSTTTAAATQRWTPTNTSVTSYPWNKSQPSADTRPQSNGKNAPTNMAQPSTSIPGQWKDIDSGSVETSPPTISVRKVIGSLEQQLKTPPSMTSKKQFPVPAAFNTESSTATWQPSAPVNIVNNALQTQRKLSIEKQQPNNAAATTTTTTTQNDYNNKTQQLNSTVLNDIENSLTEEWWDSLFKATDKNLSQTDSSINQPAGGNVANGLHAVAMVNKAPPTDTSLSSTAAALRLSGALQRAPSNVDTSNASGNTTLPTKKMAPPTMPKDPQKLSILNEWKSSINDNDALLKKGPRTMEYDKLKEASLLKERPHFVPHNETSEHSDSVYHGDREGRDSDYEQQRVKDREYQSVETRTVSGEAKPVKFEGIGPTDDKTGIPIATRKSVDEAHHKDWYRCMYKSLHKVDKQPDNKSMKPAYVLTDGEMSSNELDNLLSSPDSVIRAPSPDAQSLYPPHARYRVHRYKNQPLKIEDYEPGFHSSIAQKQLKTCESERLLENLKSPEDSFEQKRRQQRQQQRGTSRSASRADGRTFRQQWDEENYKRRQEIERIIEAERHKRFIDEQRAIQARKHSDYLNPLQKTRMFLDRFDEDALLSANNLERPIYKAATRVRGKARAIHSFHAQSNSELPLRKGDSVYLLRQVDKNWFKGERHGRVGIFPVNYVEVLTSLDEALINAGIREGKAWARFNIKGQSNCELSLRKGDVVKLIRRIDDNWYEARAGNRQGIVPVSFVDTDKEPDTPAVTPMSSRAQTPVQGRLSPTNSVISVGPDVPSAPISPWMSDFYDSEFEGDSRRSRDRSRDSDGSRDSTLDRTHRSATRSSNLAPGTTNYTTYRSQGILDRGPYRWPASEPSTLSRSEPERSNTVPRDLFHLARQRRQEVDDPHGLLDWTGSLPRPIKGYSDTAESRTNWTSSLPRQKDLRDARLLPGAASTDKNSHVNSLDRKDKNMTSSLRAQSSSPSRMTSLPGSLPGSSLPVSTGRQAVSSTAKTINNHNLQRYHALFSYVPRHIDELELQEGDVIQVLEKCDDGWFVGTSERTNEFGTFPGNYVQLVDAP